MKYNILLVSLIVLMGSQITFGQDHLIKGKVIDYETNHPIIGVTVIPDSLQNGALTDKNGNFDIKGDTKKLELYFVGYYPIRFINMPVENKQTDLGDIKLVANHHDDHMITGQYSEPLESDIERDEKLRKKVLKMYRINVCGKKLKPYFDKQFLVVDFNEN